jgi:hypothetical protein
MDMYPKKVGRCRLDGRIWGSVHFDRHRGRGPFSEKSDWRNVVVPLAPLVDINGKDGSIPVCRARGDKDIHVTIILARKMLAKDVVRGSNKGDGMNDRRRGIQENNECESETAKRRTARARFFKR